MRSSAHEASRKSWTFFRSGVLRFPRCSRRSDERSAFCPALPGSMSANRKGETTSSEETSSSKSVRLSRSLSTTTACFVPRPDGRGLPSPRGSSCASRTTSGMIWSSVCLVTADGKGKSPAARSTVSFNQAIRQLPLRWPLSDTTQCFPGGHLNRCIQLGESTDMICHRVDGLDALTQPLPEAGCTHSLTHGFG